MYLVKTRDGSYIPYDDTDHEESKKIPYGSVIKGTQARNYKHHKKAFALLTVGYDNQEKYQNFEIYRKVVTILAGYYDEVPSKIGPQFIPRSISYANMSQQDFNKWYEDTMRVVAKDLDMTVEQLTNEV